MSRFRAANLVPILLLAGAATAQEIGSKVPEIRFVSVFQFDRLPNKRLSDLHGSAVLMVFGGLGQSFAAQVAGLNELHRQRGPVGLVVVGLVDGETADIEAFLSKRKVEFQVAIGAKGGEGTYEIESLPFAFLLDPEGVLVWKGKPREVDAATLDQAMLHAKPPYVAAGVEPIVALTKEDKAGLAYAKAKELAAAEATAEDARLQAQWYMRTIEAAVVAAIDGATAATTASDYHRAYAFLAPIAKAYGGVPRADEATQQLGKLTGDKKQKREIDAGEDLVAAQALAGKRDYDEAYKAYRKLVTRFRDTTAGATAQTAADALKNGGKLGFMRGCGACEAADKACSLHAKKH